MSADVVYSRNSAFYPSRVGKSSTGLLGRAWDRVHSTVSGGM